MVTEIVLGILSFTVIVNVMVAIILLARSQLVSTGDVTIESMTIQHKKLLSLPEENFYKP